MKVNFDPKAVEAQNILDWRINGLRRGGFNKKNAGKLAVTSVDYRYAAEVLRHAKGQGYSEDFVVKLLT